MTSDLLLLLLVVVVVYGGGGGPASEKVKGKISDALSSSACEACLSFTAFDHNVLAAVEDDIVAVPSSGTTAAEYASEVSRLTGAVAVSFLRRFRRHSVWFEGGVFLGLQNVGFVCRITGGGVYGGGSAESPS